MKLIMMMNKIKLGLHFKMRFDALDSSFALNMTLINWPTNSQHRLGKVVRSHSPRFSPEWKSCRMIFCTRNI